MTNKGREKMGIAMKIGAMLLAIIMIIGVIVQAFMYF